ncbi:hypothetical protein [Actinomadura alba]|uniref:Uncharacterized protein n=1 Tax=Actinomadura alba TaxID=406431 RepID=A0ABR7M2M0_9ACTN|nr:hypothetical protein [Actinomadura alba]MBC6471353.1 hypothetical protein [Actinomadura alba]
MGRSDRDRLDRPDLLDARTYRSPAGLLLPAVPCGTVSGAGGRKLLVHCITFSLLRQA